MRRFRSICDRDVAAGWAAISVASPKVAPIREGYDEGMGHQIGACRVTADHWHLPHLAVLHPDASRDFNSYCRMAAPECGRAALWAPRGLGPA